MSTQRATRSARTPVVLRLLVVVGLAVSAAIHVRLASGAPLAAAGELTLGGLFLAQAVVAGLVALWVLLRPRGPALVAAAVVGLASATALVVSVYVLVPSVGPLPAMYEPFWYPEKVLALVAALVGGLAAVVALLARRRRAVVR